MGLQTVWLMEDEEAADIIAKILDTFIYKSLRTYWETHRKVMPLGEIWFWYKKGTKVILLKDLQ